MFVIFPRVLSVKPVRLLAICGEKAGAWIVRSQRLEELFEGGVEAAVRGYQYLSGHWLTR